MIDGEMGAEQRPDLPPILMGISKPVHLREEWWQLRRYTPS